MLGDVIPPKTAKTLVMRRSWPVFRWLLHACAIAILSVAGCNRPPEAQPRAITVAKPSMDAKSAVDLLARLEYLEPKQGEKQTDVVALENATPCLIDKLLDDTPTKYAYLFQYKVGDAAHALLCEIYKKDALWPVEGQTPMGGHPSLTFMDYCAYVEAPNGRRTLQDRWRTLVEAQAK
jgi:hypothetical protein